MQYTLEKSPFLLITILIAVVLGSISTTIYVLYEAAYQEQKERLIETVTSHARLMEAIARYDSDQMQQAQKSTTLAEAATLSQIEDAHRNYIGTSQTGEFTLAKLDGEKIRFLIKNRYGQSIQEDETGLEFTMGGEYAVPMQKALQGQSGTIIAKDYQGTKVLAAYEPVAVLNYGVVAKINLDEIQQPFIEAITIAFLISLVLTLAGALIFQRLTAPLIQRIVKSEQQAVAANLAKDEFLASMSHELRTPLTAIIGNSDYLAHGEQDPKRQSIIETIHIAGRNQLALINDILDVSKIKSGKFSIEEAPYNLADLVAEIRRLFAIPTQNSRIPLRIITACEERRLLIGDAQRISQILINLISNAIKFTHRGSVTLTLFIRNNKLHFQVEDTGIGMSDETLSRLFSRFEQADSSTCRRFGGSGLGLFISRSLAELMGGEISVTSKEGTGSTFTLTLPYCPSNLPSRQEPTDNDELPSHYQGKVLVAEDVVMLHMLMRNLLESLGVEVKLVSNGQEALEAAQHEPFDLILMDMQMPVMDGIEATRRLREANNQTPVVALTANVLEKHHYAFKSAGADGFLAKPIDTGRLKQVLSRYLTPISPAANQKSAENSDFVTESSMQLFIERLHEFKLQLSDAITKEQWEEVRNIAHVIKGSAALFGHPELSELGAVICAQIDQGKSDTLPEQSMELLFKITAVIH